MIHLERSIDMAALFDHEAHLPLAVRGGARRKLARRLVGTHDGGFRKNWWGI
jgi:hypothetical protein